MSTLNKFAAAKLAGIRQGEFDNLVRRGLIKPTVNGEFSRGDVERMWAGLNRLTAAERQKLTAPIQYTESIVQTLERLDNERKAKTAQAETEKQSLIAAGKLVEEQIPVPTISEMSSREKSEYIKTFGIQAWNHAVRQQLDSNPDTRPKGTLTRYVAVVDETDAG